MFFKSPKVPYFYSFRILQPNHGEVECHLRTVDQAGDSGSSASSSRWKTIFKAAEKGSVDDIRFFIEQGANVNKKDDFGTPLHHAAKYNSDASVVKYLIEQGANINYKNKNGERPLHIAAAYNSNVAVIECLIKSGADVNKKRHSKDCTYSGDTPLHIAAAFNSNLDVLKCLIKNKADVNIKADYGLTPLHYALSDSCAYLKVVKYLIEKGADVNAEDDAFETPLHHATQGDCNIGVIKCLLTNGAKVNAKTNWEETPLHFAAENSSNVNVLKLLIAHGADVNAKAKIKWVPIDDSSMIYCMNMEGIINNDVASMTPLDFANTEGKKVILRAAGGKSGKEL